MTNVPFWIDTASIQKFPRLQRNLTVDVVVIGAGVTGITVAYLLKKFGSTLALVERERVASMDTGHTTAHLTYVTDVGLQELARNFGENHAQATWDAGAAAIDEIERIVGKEGIECENPRLDYPKVKERKDGIVNKHSNGVGMLLSAPGTVPAR